MPDPRNDPPMVALSRKPVEAAGFAGDELEETYSLRPRSAPQILDLGVEVLAHRFLACVGICVLLWLPLRLLMPFFQHLGETSVTFDWGWFLGSLIFVMVLQGLINILATTAVTLLSYRELLGSPLGVAETLARTVRRFFGLILVFIITWLILLAGLILLGILTGVCPPFALGMLIFYLYFMWRLSIAPSALILEDLGVIEAIRRSFELSQKSFWRFFGVFLLAQILAMGFNAGLQAGDYPMIYEAAIESMGIPEPVYQGFIIVLSSLFSGVVTAISAVAITAYYLDTRIRREGLDLEMRLERLCLAHATREDTVR